MKLLWLNREDEMMDTPRGDALLRLTVGVTVYSDDEHKIGTVKEIKGQHFKVGPGFLQRDFWLPADCIGAVVAGEPVILRVSKAELDQYKSTSAPDQAA